MWDKITPYINTGKKLKIKGDKLFAILLQNRFRGTLFVHAGAMNDEIVLEDEKAFSQKSPSYFAFALQNALFSLSTSSAPKGPGIDSYEFLFEIIKAYPADMLTHLLEQYKTENVTIKPEVARFSFIKAPLEKYAGKSSFPALGLFLEQVHILYFILLTEYAAFLKASDVEKQRAAEEEKRRTEESKQESERKAIANTQEWHELEAFVKRTFKYESIQQLLEWDEAKDIGEVHKTYLRFVQKLHPDKLQHAPEGLKERASELLAVINAVYPLLKDDDSRMKVLTLTKKYGNIRTKERYEELLEVDELVLRGDAFYKMQEFGKAYKIYVEMYGRTKAVWLLEKMIYAYYNNKRPEQDAAKGIRDERRVSLEGKHMKLRDYVQRLRDYKANLPLEILYILSDVYEKERNIVMLRKTLQETLVIYPGETKARAWLQKVDEFLQNRKKT
ncbi:MAG TPA: J domain-containing protein [bacterium]|nr:J domain-containing protein [bacterium]